MGKKAKELKKAAEALHQEERSGNKGRKWRKNVKAVEKVCLPSKRHDIPGSFTCIYSVKKLIIEDLCGVGGHCIYNFKRLKFFIDLVPIFACDPSFV